MNKYELGHEWEVGRSMNGKVDTVDISVFFRGLGGTTDCAVALAKLAKAKIMPKQVVMVDGVQFQGEEKIISMGEADMGLRYLVSEKYGTQKLINKVYAALMDLTYEIDDETCGHMDQYSKIQMNHRINNGDWNKCIDYWEYTEQQEKVA
jgi:hypothetical protein